MADDRLEVEIVLDDGSIQKGFAKMEKGAKRVSKDVGSSFKSLLGPLAAVGAAVGTAFAGRKIIAAAIEQQEAVNGLAASLRSIGEASRQIELEQFAAQLQQVTKFGDEAIISQLSFAQAMGASAGQSKDILRAATDMSAALNIDLNSAVRNISKTLGGYAGELGEVIPELKNLTQEQLRNGDGVALLAKKYQGFAQAEIKTFSGAISQLGNNFGDLLEKIGDVIIKNPVIIKGIQTLNSFVGELSNNIFKLGINLIEYVVKPLELVFNVFNFVFGAIRTGIQGMVAGLGSLLEGAARVAEFFGGEGKVTKALKMFGESSRGVFADMAIDTNKSMGNLFNVDISENAANFLAQLQSQMDAAGNIAEEKVNVINKKVKKITVDLTSTLKSGLVSAMTSVGAALARGENAFNAFGSAILGMIGDMAIQIGSTLIATGLGMEALKASIIGLTGGPAIFAGLALVALGGLLKSLSGGGASSESASGGGAPTGPEAVQPEPSDFVEEDVNDTGQGVIINIEGTVLDPAGVGQQIVDVLNEAGFTNGSRVIA